MKVKYLVSIFQFIFLISYFFFVTTEKDADKFYPNINTIIHNYSIYIKDYAIFSFLGFGLSFSLYDNFMYSGIIYVLYVYAIVLQYFPLINQFFYSIFYNEYDKIFYDLTTILSCQKAIIAILISLMGCFAKLSTIQLYLYSIICTTFYALNLNIIKHFQIIDHGMNIEIYLFGSFFGYIINKLLHQENTSEKSIQKINLYLHLLGNLILFVYFPFINSSNNIGGQDEASSLLNFYIISSSMLINNLLCSDSTNINNLDNILITSGILSSSIGGINTEIGSLLLISFVFASFQIFLVNIGFYNDNYDKCTNHNFFILFNSIISGFLYIFFLLLSDDKNIVYHLPHHTTNEQVKYQLYSILTTLGMSLFGAILCSYTMNYLNDKLYKSYKEDSIVNYNYYKFEETEDNSTNNLNENVNNLNEEDTNNRQLVNRNVLVLDESIEESFLEESNL